MKNLILSLKHLFSLQLPIKSWTRTSSTKFTWSLAFSSCFSSCLCSLIMLFKSHRRVNKNYTQIGPKQMNFVKTKIWHCHYSKIKIAKIYCVIYKTIPISVGIWDIWSISNWNELITHTSVYIRLIVNSPKWCFDFGGLFLTPGMCLECF